MNWQQIIGLLCGRRGDESGGKPDVGSEAVEVSNEVFGRGSQGFIGQWVEGVEDEQGDGGVGCELGTAGLAPVPTSAGHAGSVTERTLGCDVMRERTGR